MPPRHDGWDRTGAAARAALAVLLLLPLAAAVAASASAGEASSYAHWWGTPAGWRALGRTLQLAGAGATLAVALAAGICLAAGAVGERAARVAALLACVPLLVPSSLLASAWIALLGPVATWQWRHPVLGGRLELLAAPAAAAALASRYFGIAVLALLPERLRQRRMAAVERAFRVPARPRLAVLRLRPLLRPAAAAWLLTAVFCMNDHILPDMLLVATYGTQVLVQYAALLEPAGAAALAVPVAGIGAVLAAAAVLVGQRSWRRTDETGLPPARGTWLAALPAAGLLAAPLALPVAALAGDVSPALLWAALADAAPQAWLTLRLAPTAGAVAALLAAVLAGGWLAARRSGGRALAMAALLNLAVPATLLALGVTWLDQRLATRAPALAAMIDRPGGPPWLLLAACVARFAPVAVLLLFVAWSGEPPEPDLAARTHGVPRWRAALRVRWPRRLPAVLAAATLCALLAAVELEMSILLAPPGGATLGVRLYSMIHTAPPPLVHALTLDLLLLTVPGLAVLAAVARCGRRGRDV